LQEIDRYVEGGYVVRSYYCSCCSKLTLVQEHIDATGHDANKKTAGDVTSITG
tara:strand:+ start:2381 stop:2539 length:159 start_codon:yes stop_codon:yes gene_type:complete